MAISKIALSLIKRNAPYRGPRSSDSWNDTIDELTTDLSFISGEWNSKLVPLLSTVPDGTDDVSIDAFLNGLDGVNLYVDSAATDVSDNGEYWDVSNIRPLTVKETFNAVKEEIDSNYSDLSSLVLNSTSGLTQDQKRGIGLEIFADDYVFSGTSIYSRSYNNFYNSVQLARDIYGPTYALDNDGIANLTNPIADHIDKLLTLHNGTGIWPDGDLGTVIHAIMNVDVAASAGIDQDKIDNSTGLYDDTLDVDVYIPTHLLDDLNVLRSAFKDVKGTGTWTTDIAPHGSYPSGPISIQGHIQHKGSENISVTNPHGMGMDDLGGSHYVNLETYLGNSADWLETQGLPPFPVMTYISNGADIVSAIVELEAALVVGVGDITTHLANLSNPHQVSALQLGGDNIFTELNSEATAQLDWDRLDKTGSDLADLATKSHLSLTDTGVKTHATIDSEINGILADYITSTGVTYEALDVNGDIGNTADTLCAGDDSRLLAQFELMTHRYGYTNLLSGGGLEPNGEHYALDIEFEDFFDNFTAINVEAALEELYQLTVSGLDRTNHSGTQEISTLSDHNKTNHDSLNIDADTVDGQHMTFQTSIQTSVGSGSGTTKTFSIASTGTVQVIVSVFGSLDSNVSYAYETYNADTGYEFSGGSGGQGTLPSYPTPVADTVAVTAQNNNAGTQDLKIIVTQIW